MNINARHTDQSYTPSYQCPGAASRVLFQRNIDGLGHGPLQLGGVGSGESETRPFLGPVHWKGVFTN
jgi:hypothetical protein